MILIGLGANLSSPEYGLPKATLTAALDAIAAAGIQITALSRWYSTAPVPVSDQPHYVNVVAALETDLDAPALLTALHEIEIAFGRVRGERNASRVIDIDLLDYNGQESENWPLLPHPRMVERAFVLVPLQDIAPNWQHPVTGVRVAELVTRASDRSGVHLLSAACGGG